MSDGKINNILIVGGGTAGWMVAAAFAHLLKTSFYRIQLIESEKIGAVGVGEATIPSIINFNKMLGIDENDFIVKTQGTFKLGIQFVDWKKIGHSYIHPFGALGNTLGVLPFYHYLIKHLKADLLSDAAHFSISAQAALQNKFMQPVNLNNSPLSQIGYAYHFDAALYAKYLREYSEARGVIRSEGEITDVKLDPDTGYVQSVVTVEGDVLEADLFIDCTGFRALLMNGALNVGYEDWSQWLPCDSAIAVPATNTKNIPPFTRSIARDSGWQWYIPLQHRSGNGYVYSSKYITDIDAKKLLLNNLAGPALDEPRLIKFKTGMRKKFWIKNCVAIGLSSGFLEPLESTSLHLIQSSILKLIPLLPAEKFHNEQIDKYNEMVASDFEAIRNFVILHYKIGERKDSKFWQYCRDMDIPDSLYKKIKLYENSGRIFRDNNELFDELSWFAVMNGQGIVPDSYHPLVDHVHGKHLMIHMKEIKDVISRSVSVMPTHEEYLKKISTATN